MGKGFGDIEYPMEEPWRMSPISRGCHDRSPFFSSPSVEQRTTSPFYSQLALHTALVLSCKNQIWTDLQLSIANPPTETGPKIRSTGKMGRRKRRKKRKQRKGRHAYYISYQ
jgi:hypothetical protein